MKISSLELPENLTFVCDENAFSGVKKISRKVIGDIKKVFGFEATIAESLDSVKKNAVIFGTVDKCSILQKLEKMGKINLSKIRGKWEVFGFFVIEKPFDDKSEIQNAIVIAGSDKRGTIYGLFHISEILGVSPFVNWADAIPRKKDFFEFSAKEHDFVSKEPSVKYRGFFINDEWPAFGNWSLKRFGGPNAECYDAIFEILLRMKGNYLWPAMWSAVFSWDGPGLKNAELADEYGVVMSTSHHEACGRAGEEHKHYRQTTKEYGEEWNFQKNRDGVTRFWQDGLRRNKDFENIFTIGMRGECDTAIMGREATLEDNINLLKDVITTQYDLMKKEIDPDLSKIRRQLVMFSEVDKFYFGNETTKGLKDTDLLDNVTIMMTDDNYGMLRALPDQEMRNHNGGLGLYYHFDFHGPTHCYEWVNENFLPRAWEQLSMAYDYGIKEIWIVNAGDVGLVEFPVNYFMDMAYDFEKYGSSKPNSTELWTKNWLDLHFAQYFSEKDMILMNKVVNLYTKLNARCKIETMNDSIYHPTNFGECDELLEISDEIIESCKYLLSVCPDKIEAAFWQFVYYSAVGSANVHKLWCITQKNHLYAKQNRIEANLYANKIKELIEFDQNLTDTYHKVANGKFYGFGLSEHIGFEEWNDENDKKPIMMNVFASKKTRLIVNPVNFTEYIVGTGYSQNELYIDSFMNQKINQIEIDLAPSNNEKMPYTVKTDCAWLNLSHEKGVAFERSDKLTVFVDREKLSLSVQKGTVFIDTDFSHCKLIFSAQKIDTSFVKELTFFESEGIISIEAAHFSKNYSKSDFRFVELQNYGKTLSAMKVLPSLHDDFDPKKSDTPYLEYTFYAEKNGTYNVLFYFSPTNPVKINNVMKYAYAINDSTAQIKNVVDLETFVTYFSHEWEYGADNNIQIRKAKIECKKGINKLKFYALSPTIVLEKIVLHRDEKKLPESFLGAPESFCAEP